MIDLAQFRLVYLATPYSKYPADLGGIEGAFKDASRVAGKLMTKGVKVYSPIAHTHPLAIYGEVDPYSHDIWLPFDQTMMDLADACAVAMMPTWDKSRGIAHEIEVFENVGKPVIYLGPDYLATL